LYPAAALAAWLGGWLAAEEEGGRPRRTMSLRPLSIASVPARRRRNIDGATTRWRHGLSDYLGPMKATSRPGYRCLLLLPMMMIVGGRL